MGSMTFGAPECNGNVTVPVHFNGASVLSRAFCPEPIVKNSLLESLFGKAPDPMSVHAAPLEDMRLAVRHFVEVKELAKLSGSEMLEDREPVDAILEQAGKFVEMLLPIDRAGDLEGALD